mgnify:CR=1 FL=1
MKKIIISTLLICVAFVSCKNEKAKEKTEDVVVTEVSTITDGSYITNVENSTLNWKGFKPTGTHNGTVNIKEGNLTVADGKLVGGNFVFDMSTITVLDIPAEDEYNGKLVGHLSNPDFFDVEKNPTTTFEIVEVVYGDNTSVKGNLTIKGKVIIGAAGIVKGNISASTADIEGETSGQLKVIKTLTVKAMAKISGDVVVGKLSIENGFSKFFY